MTSATFVLLTCGFVQAAAPPPGPPKGEVTEGKRKALSESMQAIQQLGRLLDQLGDPRREPGESADEYILRVQRIYKGRALYVTLLAAEYQRALERKFELEADLEAYTEWALNDSSQRQETIGRYEERVVRLKRNLVDYRQHGLVVANLLRDRLIEQATQAELSGRDEEAAGLRREASRFDPYAKWVTNVVTRSEIEDDYRDLTVEKLREQLEQLQTKVQDTEFEIYHVDKNVLKEFPSVMDNLVEAQREAIAKSNELLGQLRGLEDRAAKVAIVARNMIPLLRTMQLRAPDPNNMLGYLRTLAENDQDLRGTLNVITDVGGPWPTRTGDSTVLNLDFLLTEQQRAQLSTVEPDTAEADSTETDSPSALPMETTPSNEP